MASSKITLPSVLLLAFAALYQYQLRDILFNTLGISRKIQPISDFPYTCRRIENDPALQACEDMWLDQSSRQLFLACSDPLSRKYWMPNIHRLNASGRGLNDHIVAMDIDKPTSSGSFSCRVLKTPNFPGVAGDGRLNVVGITGKPSRDSSTVKLFLVNARPSVDAQTGELLDNEVVGGNATVEVFEAGPDATTLKHIHTFADTQIATPNNIAPTDEGGFYFTNDHGLHKIGWRCRLVTSGFGFPNGLLLASDGLIYIPSALTGGITVLQPQPSSTNGAAAKQIHFINLDYPIDNLHEDAEGAIFAATMPRVLEGLAAFNDPLNIARTPSAAVHRVRRVRTTPQDENEYVYEVTKVIEDAKGEALPGATTAVHDAKTGRLFISGKFFTRGTWTMSELDLCYAHC
ncbi:hypothetical protein LTR07_006577 [Exophiala xenobiotica]|nr:hypothetical protein LTS06_009211 [Exophiala xenobiotica]KAK5394820.1 hypothetical protein LTR79_007436 [Exophiala xenobiotica]KAK5491330.1 hypothetical protein LTR83_006171 [Exophiala xenobiotica]KAK5516795.1 hypothetical protein LTR07_006577 [Exophiala xenobiotica]